MLSYPYGKYISTVLIIYTNSRPEMTFMRVKVKVCDFYFLIYLEGRTYFDLLMHNAIHITLNILTIFIKKL